MMLMSFAMTLVVIVLSAILAVVLKMVSDLKKTVADVVATVKKDSEREDSNRAAVFEAICTVHKQQIEMFKMVNKTLNVVENVKQESYKNPPQNDDGLLNISDNADFEGDIDIVKNRKYPASVDSVNSLRSLWIYLRSPHLNPEVLSANWLMCESKKDKKEALKHITYVKKVFVAAEVEYPKHLDFSQEIKQNELSIVDDVVKAINLEKTLENADEEAN